MPLQSRASALAIATALAAMPAVMPLAAAAEEAGFAVELAPPERFAPLRADMRVFGPTVEPASAYVRGCEGHVVAESAGAVFDVTARIDRLAFTAAGEGVVGLVLGTPDGLYRCARSDEAANLASTELANAEPGRYRVWVAGEADSVLDVRLIAADRALSGLELFGFDAAMMGAPREGRFTFTASAGTGRQVLTSAGTMFADTPLRPLNPDYCPGHGRLDAPDAVLTLDTPEDRMSIFAMSSRDLTIGVAAPDGRVLCNDDTFGLHPAVTFDDAPAGDYHIFVGAFSSGGTAQYELFASQGGPEFVDPAQFDGDVEPRHGRARFDPSLAGRAQLLATAPVQSNDPFSSLPIGSHCPGYTGTDAPDLVLTLDAPEEQFSLMAMSPTDLVMAVRLPDGSWECNDDSYGLHPGITMDDAAAGDYMIYVGTFGRGRSGEFNLFASQGGQNWQDAEGAQASAGLNAEAEPAIARVSFGPDTPDDPRIVFDIPRSTDAAFGMGPECAGYITAARPDIVVTAEDGLEEMLIYMVAQGDGTLVVVGPDGRLHCNDDYEGLHPGLVFSDPAPGDYAVFAGTFGGQGGIATLGVTQDNPVWTLDREP